MPRKPPIRVRRPSSQSVAAEVVEDFVRGDALEQEKEERGKIRLLDVQTSERPDVQTSGATSAGKSIVERADGRKRRRMTVYLPPELAGALRMHCVAQDMEMSAVVAEAVREYLEGR